MLRVRRHVFWPRAGATGPGAICARLLDDTRRTKEHGDVNPKVTIRPGRSTAVVLPYTEDPTANYRLLEGCIGGAKNGPVLYENGSFYLADQHTMDVINGLLIFFERVHIIDYARPLPGSPVTRPQPSEYDVTEPL